MHENFIFPSVTEALPRLLDSLEEKGLVQSSRNGETKELTHIGITLTDPVHREILCEHRKPNIAAQIAETMWVLAGRSDVEWLGNYLPRAASFSDDGEVWRAGYGARLRSWQDHGNGRVLDQWKWLVEHLKEDLQSRRAVMSIWDPVTDTAPGLDIPCNDWLSFLHRDGFLDLHVAIRSNDVIWGWSGINQFEWSALLEITAGMLGVKVGSLHFSTTSFHLYDHHYRKADAVRSASPVFLDNLNDSPRFDASVFDYYDFDKFQELIDYWFRLEYDIRTGSPLVDGYIEGFPEPMLRSWLRVLQWWWGQGDQSVLRSLHGTRLFAAVQLSLQPKNLAREAAVKSAAMLRQGKRVNVLHALQVVKCRRVTDIPSDKLPAYLEALNTPVASPFLKELQELHLEKEEAYGGSWKKRGELFSILPNICRKVDRLGSGETSDETQADTSGDLLVYLAKYRTWLSDQGMEPLSELSDLSDYAHHANTYLVTVEQKVNGTGISHPEALESTLKKATERLLALAEEKSDERVVWVDDMVVQAYRLARYRWEATQTVEDYLGADVD